MLFLEAIVEGPKRRRLQTFDLVQLLVFSKLSQRSFDVFSRVCGVEAEREEALRGSGAARCLCVAH